MRNAIIGLAVTALMTIGAPSLQGQEETERYIPIGRSPGISGTSAWMGQVEAIDATNQTVTVRGPNTSRTIAVIERTRIWLDRSTLRLTNLSGTFADLAVGQTVEIKYLEDEPTVTADWIKIAVTSGGP